jgi:hypothetical protein
VTCQEIAGRFGIQHMASPMASTGDQMIVGAWASGAPVSLTFRTGRTARSWGERFEIARAIGHALTDPIRAGALGAASGTMAPATRRRRSGAFAAELLLPEAALAEISGGRLDGAAHSDAFADLLQQ